MLELLSWLSGLAASFEVVEKDSYNYWDSVGFLWVVIAMFAVMIFITACVLWERRHQRRRKESA